MISELVDISAAKDLSLPMTGDYRVYRYDENGSCVYFSCARQGNAMAIHLAADRAGKRVLRRALNAMCEAIFSTHKWCEVVLGVVGKKSVVNLAKKCGFAVIGNGTATVNGEQKKATVVGRWP